MGRRGRIGTSAATLLGRRVYGGRPVPRPLLWLTRHDHARQAPRLPIRAVVSPTCAGTFAQALGTFLSCRARWRERASWRVDVLASIQKRRSAPLYGRRACLTAGRSAATCVRPSFLAALYPHEAVHRERRSDHRPGRGLLPVGCPGEAVP